MINSFLSTVIELCLRVSCSKQDLSLSLSLSLSLYVPCAARTSAIMVLHSFLFLVVLSNACSETFPLSLSGS